MSHTFRHGTELNTSQPHLEQPQRNDLLGLLHEAHSGVVYRLLESLDSDEARRSIAEHSQPSGSFSLSPPFCVGRIKDSTGRDCDLFLAPGVATTVWPVHTGRGRSRDVMMPVRLFARRGINANQDDEHRWERFNVHWKAWQVAQPRVLTARTHAHVARVRTDPQPYQFKLSTDQWATWRQIVWDQESESFRSDANFKDRIERGDPDSPTISYCELTIEDAGYTDIVCSAIVKERLGKFRPWTTQDPLVRSELRS
ncbi:uncharacterized protein JCM6883_001715 [Sporobolomyces salmoneus]|uniref:uncharacterized protein n=1 Tax=Sporobolomyces salmoneus TaxID=183962 RepID=UPI00316D82C8